VFAVLNVGWPLQFEEVAGLLEFAPLLPNH